MYEYQILRHPESGNIFCAAEIYYKGILAEPDEIAQTVRQYNRRDDGYSYYFERTSGYISALPYFKSEMQHVFGILGLNEGEEENERNIAAWEKGLRINSDQAAELRKYNKELKRALIAIKES